MMGSIASVANVADAQTVVALIKAASDPKLSQAVLTSFAEARKQYDDAIAESNERLKAALSAENKAEAAAAKAEVAEDKLDKKKVALDAQAFDIKEQADALAEDKKIFEAHKAEIAAQAKALADERTQMNAGATVQIKKIADDRAAFDKEVAAFDAEVQKAKDIRAEYEAKIAALKAMV